MATTEELLTQQSDYVANLNAQRNALADNLVAKGVAAAHTEKFDTLVPKVLDISSKSVLTGTAVVADVLAGKTFYNTDDETKLTGTLVVPPSLNGISILSSTSQVGAITAIAASGDYVYIGTGTASNYCIKKLNKFTLEHISTSVSYSSGINAIVINGNYLYAATSVTLLKLNLSDLSHNASYAINGGGTFIAISGDYIYCNSTNTTTGQGNIVKLNLSNLTFVLAVVCISAYTGVVSAEHLYISSIYTASVAKFRLTDLVKVASYGGGAYALAISGDYIYAAVSSVIIKLNLSDLSLVASSAICGGFYSLAIQDNYIYGGGAAAYEHNGITINKYNLSDLSLVLSSPNCGEGIQRLVLSGKYIYISGNTIYKLTQCYEN